jgi:hypothetical protein
MIFYKGKTQEIEERIQPLMLHNIIEKQVKEI